MDVLTRQEIKARAKQILRTGKNWQRLMIVNLVPWLISVGFTVNLYMLNWQVYQQTLDGNVSASLTSQSQMIGTFRDFILVLFVQAACLTALDLWRKPDGEFSPVQAMFRLFNRSWFWVILGLWLVTAIITNVGFALLVIPGILFSYGFRQVYYVMYDARRSGVKMGVFDALGASWNLMRGSKFDLFVLDVSMLGWYLLNALSANLLSFLINPYMQLTYGGFYHNLLAKRNN
ncbi:DUF975 family protein [Lacticaseibacillus saniviri]